MIELTGRVKKARTDVVRLEVRILSEDFRRRLARGEQLEHVDDADTHSSDTRTPATLLRVDRDSSQKFGFSHGSFHLPG